MMNLVLWTEWLKNKWNQEHGAGLAEYALLLFVIAVAAAFAVDSFGVNIINAFTQAGQELPAAP